MMLARAPPLWPPLCAYLARCVGLATGDIVPYWRTKHVTVLHDCCRYAYSRFLLNLRLLDFRHLGSFPGRFTVVGLTRLVRFGCQCQCTGSMLVPQPVRMVDCEMPMLS